MTATLLFPFSSIFLPKIRYNVFSVGQETSTSGRKSALHTVLKRIAFPFSSAAGYAVAHPYIPFSLTSTKCFVFLSECSLETSMPPKGSNVSSVSSETSSLRRVMAVATSFYFIFAMSFAMENTKVAIKFAAMLSTRKVFSTPFISAVTIGSLALATRVSTTFSRVSKQTGTIAMVTTGKDACECFGHTRKLSFSFGVVIVHFLDML